MASPLQDGQDGPVFDALRLRDHDQTRPMLDLFDEFVTLVHALDEARLPYAVCGGLAMAIHGLPRATVDVDLLVPTDIADSVLAVARGLGYTISAEPMTFAGGAVEIRRVTKIDVASADVLSLDLLLVTPALQEVWTGRNKIGWEHGEVSVVSREGLIALKSLRGSGQDQDDIKRLREAQ
jgi:hypothetical protein